MPAGDGSGPRGAGPGTGRGLGFCAGYAQPGYASFGPGRGSGRGWGRGFGRGRGRGRRAGWAASAPGPWFGPPAVTAASEAELLKNQVAFYEQELANLNKRLGELEAEVEAR